MSYAGSVLGCGCGGVPSYIQRQPIFEAASTAAAVSNAATLAAAASPFGNAYLPAVQVQSFEPAFYTPCPTWAVIPYSPSLVSVTVPVYNNNPVTNTVAAVVETQPAPVALAEAEVLAAAETGVPVNVTPTPQFVATSCGPCNNAFSPLPPNSFDAWRRLLQQTNAPYDALYGGGYGGVRRW